MRRVNLVVTCTKRKSRRPADALRLREVPPAAPEERASAWLDRLRAGDGEVVPALDLYAGDHWSVIRELPDAGEWGGVEVRLWICSAGYGLIPADAGVLPYSATFSAGHPDSVHAPGVVSRGEAHRRWWRALAEWKGPVPDAPRTLRALAAREPEVAVMVVASPSYLDPLMADLREAAAALRDPESLMVVSGGAGALAGLERQQVPFDARLQAQLGGAMMSLNARVAREVLSSRTELRASAVAGAIQALARDLPEFRYPERVRQTDEQVRAYLHGELSASPEARWTPLHRKLRDQLGLACEQKRFRGLWEKVRAEMAETR